MSRLFKRNPSGSRPRRAVLRSLTDRELRDIGLDRGRIGDGLAEAAKDRALIQLRTRR